MNPNLQAEDAVAIKVAMHLLKNNVVHPASKPLPKNETWWNFFIKVSTGIYLSRPCKILSIPFKVVYKKVEWLNVLQPSVQDEQLNFLKMAQKSLTSKMSTNIPIVKKNFNDYDLIFVISKKKLSLIVNVGFIIIGICISVVTINFLIKKYNGSKKATSRNKKI
uniref:Uncharacterized protein n=1 Tax=Halimeda micronesica TaxID=170426 RepID=A0A386AXE4_9CHLO|nr:hypothetical protein [Halimeda micronesica]